MIPVSTVGNLHYSSARISCQLRVWICAICLIFSFCCPVSAADSADFFRDNYLLDYRQSSHDIVPAVGSVVSNLVPVLRDDSGAPYIIGLVIPDNVASSGVRVGFYTRAQESYGAVWARFTDDTLQGSDGSYAISLSDLTGFDSSVEFVRLSFTVASVSLTDSDVAGFRAFWTGLPDSGVDGGVVPSLRDNFCSLVFGTDTPSADQSAIATIWALSVSCSVFFALWFIFFSRRR